MPPNHQWLFNVEKERAQLSEAVEKFQSILSGLEKSGTVSLSSGGEKHAVAPKGDIKYVIRYERHHNRNLSLKLELVWDERGGSVAPEEFEIILE